MKSSQMHIQAHMLLSSFFLTLDLQLSALTSYISYLGLSRVVMEKSRFGFGSLQKSAFVQLYFCTVLFIVFIVLESVVVDDE